METPNRFDLEQEIMDCWQVTSDINVLFEGVMEQNMSRDAIANILLGMKGLYELKFDKMFSTFEALIRERKM